MSLPLGFLNNTMNNIHHSMETKLRKVRLLGKKMRTSAFNNRVFRKFTLILYVTLLLYFMIAYALYIEYQIFSGTVIAYACFFSVF